MWSWMNIICCSFARNRIAEQDSHFFVAHSLFFFLSRFIYSLFLCLVVHSSMEWEWNFHPESVFNSWFSFLYTSFLISFPFKSFLLFWLMKEWIFLFGFQKSGRRNWKHFFFLNTFFVLFWLLECRVNIEQCTTENKFIFLVLFLCQILKSKWDVISTIWLLLYPNI